MHILIVICILVSGCLTSDLWMTNHDIFYITMLQEEYVGYFKSYDSRTLVFLKRDEFLILTVEDFNKVKLIASIKHGLENVEIEYIGGFATSHYIGYMTKYTFYYFKLTEDKKEIAFKEYYPASYFGINEFRPIYSINLWRGLMVIKTSEHSIHSIDFSSHKSPRIVKLKIPWTIGQSEPNEVVQIKSFGYSTEHAIRYRNNTIDVFDVVKQSPVKRYDFKEIIQYMNYDYVTNKFLVIFRNGDISFIDCASAEIIGTLPLIFTRYSGQRSYRTGTNHMVFQSDEKS